MSIEVIRKDGHYEVFVNGNFYCSADTIAEATRECHKLYESEEMK